MIPQEMTTENRYTSSRTCEPCAEGALQIDKRRPTATQDHSTTPEDNNEIIISTTKDNREHQILTQIVYQ